MKKLVTLLTLAVAIWWMLSWGLFAFVCVIGMLLPDPGSIITFKSNWWFVTGVLLDGLLLLWLLRAALRSLRGTAALTGTLLVEFLLSLFRWRMSDWWQMFIPILLLVPLLWYYHIRSLARFGGSRSE